MSGAVCATAVCAPSARNPPSRATGQLGLMELPPLATLPSSHLVVSFLRAHPAQRVLHRVVSFVTRVLENLFAGGPEGHLHRPRSGPRVGILDGGAIAK